MSDQPAIPQYGASEHYIGAKGEEYFDWQNRAVLFKGKINAHKFAAFIRSDDSVLDFGCGGGGLLATLECRRRIGVDVNPAALAAAEQLGIETYPDASLVPDESLDVAISDHALEHVPYPIGALSILRRKLKPGGRLVVCVPIDNHRHQRRYDPTDKNHHLHTWTPLLLGNTLHEAGFVVEDVRARTFAWPGRWTVACYGRLPYWLFCTICSVYGGITGKGWETIAVARRSAAGGNESTDADTGMSVTS